MCQREAPALARAHEQFAPKGVVFVGVNAAVRQVDGAIRAESEEDVKRFMAEHGWTFANGQDLDQAMVRAYNVSSTPTTFLITPNGGILGRRNGPFQEAEILGALQTLLDYKGP